MDLTFTKSFCFLFLPLLTEAVAERCSVKIVFYEIEFCKISKNIFSYRTPPAAASVLKNFVISECKKTNFQT